VRADRASSKNQPMSARVLSDSAKWKLPLSWERADEIPLRDFAGRGREISTRKVLLSNCPRSSGKQGGKRSSKRPEGTT